MTLDKAKKTFEIYKNVLKRKTKRVLYIFALAAMYLGLEAVGLEPEIIVGGIPIYNLQSIGHASSDEVLKYRAMGGIFLAHQKGGKKTFRFVAHVTGAERFLWYKLLETLQMVGTEHLTPISTKSLSQSSDLFYADQKLTQPEIPPELVKSKADIYNYPSKEKISEQEYVYHKTFPIITDSRIYTNMYLETLRMAEDVNLGRETIEIDCAFRHFEAPTHYAKTSEFQTSVDPTTKRFVAPKKKFYATYIPYKDANAWRKLENLASLLWISKRLVFDATTLRKKERGKFFVDFTNLVVTYNLHRGLQQLKYKSEATSI